MRTRPPLTAVLRSVGEFNSSLIARLKLPRKIDYNQIATTKKIKLKKNRCRILNSAPYGPSNNNRNETQQLQTELSLRFEILIGVHSTVSGITGHRPLLINHALHMNTLFFDKNLFL